MMIMIIIIDYRFWICFYSKNLLLGWKIIHSLSLFPRAFFFHYYISNLFFLKIKKFRSQSYKSLITHSASQLDIPIWWIFSLCTFDIQLKKGSVLSFHQLLIFCNPNLWWHNQSVPPADKQCHTLEGATIHYHQWKWPGGKGRVCPSSVYPESWCSDQFPGKRGSQEYKAGWALQVGSLRRQLEDWGTREQLGLRRHSPKRWKKSIFITIEESPIRREITHWYQKCWIPHWLIYSFTLYSR